jgi:hypothetical protein
MRMCTCRTTRACLKQELALRAIFNIITPKDRIRRWATKHPMRCIMQNEPTVPRARAHGGTPVLSSACGGKVICCSERELTVLCELTSCKKTNNYDRLPDQQPVIFRKKEPTNREANYFYLKSCPAHWVHLRAQLIKT